MIRYETVPTLQMLDNTEDMNSHMIFNEDTLQESVLPDESSHYLTKDAWSMDKSQSIISNVSAQQINSKV